MSIHVEEHRSHTTQPRTPALAGLLVEFVDVDSVISAARHLRDTGFSRWDVHSPFPIHGMDQAMGIRPTILPWLVLGAGLTGMATGVALQWYTNAIDYPFVTSGKPIVSFPAWIPVIFELTILFSALTAVFGMLLLNRLPRHYNPLFKSRRFRRVTNDRFFIVIDADDPQFDREPTEARLRELGATEFEWIEESNV